MGTTANIHLDPETQKHVDQWLHGHYDEKTKSEIRRLLKENPKEIIDAFYTTLSFGTGGLRGIMGVGSNRMNVYTVRAATQGLANYINKQLKSLEGHSVLIGYDSRNNSRTFAEEAAKVLAGNGIKVLLFKELRPVPLVSFGVRLKKCSAGIMITASHNPPQYNGYKVYWNDGAQVLPPHDKNIIEEVNKITDVDMVKEVDQLDNPLIVEVDKEIDEAYLDAISRLQLYREENQSQGESLNVVYTSLHGTGITIVPQALAKWGFPTLHLVDKQVIPDGNFPTAASPNPEERKALDLGIEKMKKVNGDLLIATDPDADRVGVAVNHRGSVELINGNQMAVLLLNHVCEALSSKNKMPGNAAFIKTIVTTELFQAICDYYQKPCFNVLTGFKYIAEKIRQWEHDPHGYQFIFGGEESYGYLLGTQTRDKDAVVISALICEMALHAKLQGKTIVDLLHEIYKKHGLYYETLKSIQFEESKEGKDQMAKGMKHLQSSIPKALAGVPVVALEDCQRSVKTNLKTRKTEPIGLPKSDVLMFWLEDGSKLIIRPSGTEPKIKIYCGIVKKGYTSFKDAWAECEAKAGHFVEELKNHLQGQ